MATIDFGKDAASPSGAPQAGGATSRGSRFGGDSLTAQLLRMVARVARSVEAEAYRRLRDLEQSSDDGASDPHPGAPNRVRQAWNGEERRIH